MGTRVYTWDEVSNMPYPPKDTEFPELSESLMKWGEQLQRQTIKEAVENPDTEEYIVSVCKWHMHFPGHLVLLISEGLDVSNHEKFPDSAEDWPIIYIRIGKPETY